MSERNSPTVEWKPHLIVHLTAAQMPELTQTLRTIIPLEDRASYQLSAICGNLKHRIDVHELLQNFGPQVDQYTTNQAHASYLRRRHPELVPPEASPGQPPSERTLSVVFCFHYYIDFSFRVEYLAQLSLLSA